MITHQKWSVRLYFKGWDLGTECFQSVTILAWATYARFTLLSRLPVNFLVSLETMIFRIRFLNGFILDSSRARWCVWPHLPTPECCLLVWLHGLAGMTSCWQDDSSAVLYSWECQAALSPLLSPSCEAKVCTGCRLSPERGGDSPPAWLRLVLLDGLFKLVPSTTVEKSTPALLASRSLRFSWKLDKGK